tara:strand:- start:63 stop:488 length:426 start_codon:yes stop_codon:yes gene_type:complete
MMLLTFDNAKSLLEKGEVYRIGYNALNEGEFLYEHKGFKRKDPNFADHVQQGNVLYLNGTVTWLDRPGLGTMKTDYRFYSSKAKTIQELTNADYRFQWGAFTAWNGEPLWLLDDYESTHDISHEKLNEMMLPDLFKEKVTS